MSDRGTEAIIATNGIEIWSEAFGHPDDPAVLLIMGAESQGTMWPLRLVDRLTSIGRYVVRYDHRDVGQSSVIDWRANPYTLDDLATDAIGVLDHYGLGQAHFVGASMGGMITQTLMIDRLERLLSATIMMSSPLAGKLAEDTSLPRGKVFEAMPNLPDPTQASPPQWNSREDYVNDRVKFLSALSDPAQLDPKALRLACQLEYDRARDINAKAHHFLAIERSLPTDRRLLLRQCYVRTTVIHGEQDPVFPLAHGQALADAIPNAELIAVPGMAHDLPESCWNRIVDSVR